MDATEASRLIEAGVPSGPALWADFGAGDGTFTRALAARLGPGGRILAVDRDARALERLRRASAHAEAEVVIVPADLERAFELPGLRAHALDGMLLANTLHFMGDAAGVLARLATWLRPGGSVVVVEYDGRSPSRWVPYPIDAAALPDLFAAAGLAPPQIVARADSRFGGELYVAAARVR